MSEDPHSPDSADQTATPPMGRIRTFLRFLGHTAVIGAGFLLIVGLAIRLTIRDTIPYLSVFFYATPLIVLAAAALFISANRFLNGRRKTAATCLLLSVSLFSWWRAASHFSHPVQPSEPEPTASKKLLFWNISYVDAGWPAIIQELLKHDADIIGLVEVGPGYPDILDEIKAAFPEHQLFWAGHGILLARGQWELREWGSLNRDGSFAVVRARFEDGVTIDTVLVDIHGFILMPRGPAMQSLTDVLSRHTLEPVCVMGDFNTPPDSVFFTPIRERFENAFEASGNGYYVTWPTITPVLALDQIWIPPGTAEACKLTTTPLSDHRLVTAKVRFAEALQPEGFEKPPANK